MHKETDLDRRIKEITRDAVETTPEIGAWIETPDGQTISEHMLRERIKWAEHIAEQSWMVDRNNDAWKRSYVSSTDPASFAREEIKLLNAILSWLHADRPRFVGRIETIEEAVSSILGLRAAHSIIDDMGLHWAVVAAMAAATSEDDPEAIAIIQEWNREKQVAPARQWMSGERCPTCDSPSPERHPSMGHEGEVELCIDDFHLIPTEQNHYIADVLAKRERKQN